LKKSQGRKFLKDLRKLISSNSVVVTKTLMAAPFMMLAGYMLNALYDMWMLIEWEKPFLYMEYSMYGLDASVVGRLVEAEFVGAIFQPLVIFLLALIVAGFILTR
jgi:hypothetical protein